MSFAGHDLYPDLATKAVALAYSLIQNHPFVDGNKRVGHASMETFLLLNGHELAASVEDAEAIILGVAAGRVDREALRDWIRQVLAPASE
jgi:death-on-curing protein